MVYQFTAWRWSMWHHIDMGATTSLLSFAEFEQLPDEPGKLELLDGELIRLPPPEFEHRETADQLCGILKGALAGPNRPPGLGRAYVEMGYTVGDTAWLRPDVSVLHAHRSRVRYLDGAPALAIEIISESNGADDMNRKVKKYLSNGGIEVWVLYPKTESVWVSARDTRESFAASFAQNSCRV